jgi:non-specific serine/threonine protein kinase
MQSTAPEQESGDPSDSTESLPVSTMVGEFEIIGIIGEGGFGTVYLAIDHSLQRRVALKEYRPAALATRKGQAVVTRSARHIEAFEAGLKSFVNEARTLAQFDHPALVRVYRFWQQNNTAYMAMPLVEGRTLTQIVNEEPDALTEEWLKSILAPLLDAIEALHSVHIFHRDIAPDNVLIQANGTPVLLDFGAARQIVADMTQALTVILKPGYAPIEQYAEDPSMRQGPWTDVYALGAVLHFAITHKAPPNSVTRLINDNYKPLATIVQGGFTGEFLAAIDAALAVRPDARPQSIAALRELLGLQSHASQPPRTQSLASGAMPTPRTATPSTTIGPKPAGEVDPNATMIVPRKTAIPAKPPGPSATAAPVTTSATPAVTPPTPETTTDTTPPAAVRVTGAPVASTQSPAATVPLHSPAAPAASEASTPAPGVSVAASPRGARAKPAGSKSGLLIGAAAGIFVLGAVGVYLRVSQPSGAAVEAPKAAESTTALPAAPAPQITPAAATAAPPAAQLDAGKGASPEAAKPVETAVAAEAKPAEPAPPAEGSIALQIKPWGVVVVDGEAKGASPPLKRIKLAEGKHQVELTHPAFPPYAMEVEVKKNKSVTVSYEFK